MFDQQAGFWIPPIAPGMLIPFLLAATLIELTPGPNMAYLSLVAAREGRAAGLFMVLGITLGLAVCLVASVGGLAEVAVAQPWAYQGLRWTGVGYLLWLAWDAWRGEVGRTPRRALVRTPGRLVWRGFLVNVLNPKTLVFYLTILPGFIVTARGQVARQALVFGALHIAVSVCAHGGIVMAANTAGSALGRRAAPRLMRAVAGLSIVGVAAWVFWSTRRA